MQHANLPPGRENDLLPVKGTPDACKFKSFEAQGMDNYPMARHVVERFTRSFDDDNLCNQKFDKKNIQRLTQVGTLPGTLPGSTLRMVTILAVGTS